MVADIQLLQGKIIEDPDQRAKNITRLIEELALEILSEEELAIASGEPTPSQPASPASIRGQA